MKNEIKDYILRHWNADIFGTDLDSERLEDGFRTVFSRQPEANEDTFGMLKKHFSNDLTEADHETIEESGEYAFRIDLSGEQTL